MDIFQCTWLSCVMVIICGGTSISPKNQKSIYPTELADGEQIYIWSYVNSKLRINDIFCRSAIGLSVIFDVFVCVSVCFFSYREEGKSLNFVRSGNVLLGCSRFNDDCIIFD